MRIPAAADGWRQVRRDLCLGLAAWSAVDLFFYTRMYVQLRVSDQPPFTWEEIRWAHLLEAGADALTWTLFTPLVLFLVRRFPLGRRAAPWAVHLAASVPLALANSYINWSVAAHTWPVRPALDAWVGAGLHLNVQAYWLAAAAGHALEYYRQSRERERRAGRLREQLSRARLQALRMQLHPHFLFNTLHSVTELVHADPDTAERMITRLGDLLRRTVDGPTAREVPLAEEMAFVEAYLDIERMRFRDRLTVETRVAPEARAARVPALILQPLVENALLHGLAPRAGPGRLEVRAEVAGARLRLEVRDDGVGPARDAATGRVRERVGLGNTRARLRALYGRRHRFALADAPGGGTLAVIEIPFRPVAPARPDGAAVPLEAR